VKVTLIILSFLICSPLFSQEPSAYGPYHAGFMTLQVTDSSRLYKSGADPVDRLFHRPVDIDVWYPANDTSATSMTFGDLVQLLEVRAAFYQREKNYTGIAKELLTYLALSLEVNDGELARFHTATFKNAQPAPGNFPLILYMASFNGMSYENYNLMEFLASHGFVVACVNSVGRYPGDMTIALEDLIEQVNDAIAAHRILKNLPFVDNRSTVTIGYSWGGLAACLAAPRINAEAIISMDGSEFHEYGTPDDQSFGDIRKMLASPDRTPIPYLYLRRDSLSPEVDSVYAHHVNAKGSHWIKVQNTSHEDFSALPYLAATLKKDMRDQPYPLIREIILGYLQEALGKGDQFQNFRQQLSTTKAIDTVYHDAVLRNTEASLILSGVVLDQTTHEALPYVNIGSIQKNYGTVTNAKGEFSLNIPFDLDDTLKISSIGFIEQIIPVGNIHWKPDQTIYLKEKVTVLKETVVEVKALKTRTLGHTTRSNFFGGKLGSNRLGTAIGVKINIRKAVMLDRFNFTVSYNQLDTAVFRLNVYRVEKGMPSENILTQNILYRLGKQTGSFHIDLSSYEIIVEDDIVIGLEWIEGNMEDTSSGIVFSAAPLNNGTFLRYSSQGKWKRFKGMGIGFNVRVKYLDENTKMIKK
jgi:hypothetical protein